MRTIEVYHRDRAITEMEEVCGLKRRTDVIPMVKITEDGDVIAGLEVYTVKTVIKVRDIEVIE